MDRHTEALLLVFAGVLVVASVITPSWPVAVALVAVCALLAALRVLSRMDSERRVNALSASVAAAITLAEEARKTAEKAQNCVAALAARQPTRPGY